MRWKGRERSEKVEDSRGLPVGAAVGGGGLLVIVIALVIVFMGGAPKPLLDAVNQQQGQQQANVGEAPGDFAQAYVIAHEVAHHVQNSLGLMQEVERTRRNGDQRASNQASVQLELQADYLAGVWDHHAHKEYNILEEGDTEDAMNAAIQIGDDTFGN